MLTSVDFNYCMNYIHSTIGKFVYKKFVST